MWTRIQKNTVSINNRIEFWKERVQQEEARKITSEKGPATTLQSSATITGADSGSVISGGGNEESTNVISSKPSLQDRLEQERKAAREKLKRTGQLQDCRNFEGRYCHT